MFDLIPSYFNPRELDQLRELEGKLLVRVLYTIWRNVANPTEPYEALEALELQFVDRTEIAFTRSQDSDSIEVGEYNFALEQTRIVQQFRGQVELERVDMSQSSIWEACIGVPVTAIGLEHHGPNQHPSHVLQLEFGKNVQQISLGEEGLLAKNLSV